jgi:hypothetical protein
MRREIFAAVRFHIPPAWVVAPCRWAPKYRMMMMIIIIIIIIDRLCGLVVRVLGYRFGGPGSIPGTNRKKKI